MKLVYSDSFSIAETNFQMFIVMKVLCFTVAFLRLITGLLLSYSSTRVRCLKQEWNEQRYCFVFFVVVKASAFLSQIKELLTVWMICKSLAFLYYLVANIGIAASLLFNTQLLDFVLLLTWSQIFQCIYFIIYIVSTRLDPVLQLELPWFLMALIQWGARTTP